MFCYLQPFSISSSIHNHGNAYAREVHPGKNDFASRGSDDDQEVPAGPNADRSADEAGVHRKDLLHDYDLYRWNRRANV